MGKPWLLLLLTFLTGRLPALRDCGQCGYAYLTRRRGGTLFCCEHCAQLHAWQHCELGARAHARGTRAHPTRR